MKNSAPKEQAIYYIKLKKYSLPTIRWCSGREDIPANGTFITLVKNEDRHILVGWIIDSLKLGKSIEWVKRECNDERI